MDPFGLGGIHIGGSGNFDIGGDEVHAEGATGSTNHEKIATTQIIDEDQKPDESQSSLDHAKDASGKEASVGASDAETLENGGAVVVDCIDTRT